MKRLFQFLVLVLLITSTSFATAQSKRVRQVTILLDGPQQRVELVKQLQSEITQITQSEYQVEYSVVTGDWTAEGATKNLDAVMADPKTSLVIAAGGISSALSADRKSFDKPTISLSVIDPELQGFSMKGGSSSVPNFTFYTLPFGFQDGVDDFQKYWKFKKLGVITEAALMTASPKLLAGLQKQLLAKNIELVHIPLAPTYEETLASVPEDVDAIYVGRLRQYSDEDFKLLMDGLHKRKLLTYAHAGAVDVNRGALMGSAPSTDITSMSRRVALAVLGALKGEKLDKMPLGFLTATPHLVLNVQVAQEVGFSPNWVLLADADLVGKSESPEDELSLDDAVQEALAQNPELLAQTEQLSATGYDVDRAWTAYKPLLDIYVAGMVTAPNQAKIQFGTSQYQGAAGASLEQIIYNVDASGGVDVNVPLQKSRALALEGKELDVFRDVAIAYISVLRTHSLEEVARENLYVSRSNLQLADMRVSIGVSDPSDVYRWQTEIAGAQAKVLQASADVDSARAILQQHLGRTGALKLRVAGIDSASTLGQLVGEIPEFFDDPISAAAFEEFLVSEAINNTPALDQLDQQMKAQESVVSQSSRAWFLPTLGLSANLQYIFARAGEGSETEIPGFGSVPDIFWSAEAFVRLPILEQGTRVVDEDQANATIIALKNEKRAQETQIEKQIRLALTSLRVSYSNIEITARGYEAATKNLELVTANYMRGTANVIVLTDAQSLAFRSDQAAEDAKYQYLVDVVSLVRILGRTTVSNIESKSDLVERYKAFRSEKKLEEQSSSK